MERLTCFYCNRQKMNGRCCWFSELVVSLPAGLSLAALAGMHENNCFLAVFFGNKWLSICKTGFLHTNSSYTFVCIHSSVKGRCWECCRINALCPLRRRNSFSLSLGLNDDRMNHPLFWDCEPDRPPPSTNPPSSWPRHLKPRPRQLILFVWPFVLDSPAALYLFVSARNPVPSLLNQPTPPSSALLKLSPTPSHPSPSSGSPHLCNKDVVTPRPKQEVLLVLCYWPVLCVSPIRCAVFLFFIFIFLGGRSSYLCVCYSVLEHSHEQKSQDVFVVSGMRPFKSANSLSCDVFADNFRVFLCV